MLLTLADKLRSPFRSAAPSRFVAVDFDGRMLRVADAEPHKDLPRFRKLADIEAPGDLDAKDAAAVGAFIGASLKQLGLDGMRVVMDVPRSKAVLKTLTLPPVDNARELPAMVRYQVERELPFPLAEAIVDFTVDKQFSAGGGDGETPQGVQVLVAAVRQTVVAHYKQIAEAAGIRLHCLGLRPYADIRCLEVCLTQQQHSLNTALVHVLADEAEINVLIRGSLVFSRAAPIKRRDENHEPLSAGHVVDALAVEVARSVQSALSAHRGQKVDQVWIAGDTGDEAALAEAVHQRLDVPTERLDPVGALRIKRAKTQGRGAITPVGLAIAHGAPGEVPFDFLNPKKPPVERDVKKIRRIAASVAAAVVLLVLAGVGLANRFGHESRHETLREEYNRLEKESRPVARLGRRVDEVQSWVDEGVAWLDHWANVAAHLPPATEAYVTSFKAGPGSALTLTVKARSSRVITDAGRRLTEAGYIVKVGSESTTTDEYGYAFTTTIRLDVPSDQQIELASLRAAPRPADDGSAELIRRPSRGSPSERPGSSPPPSQQDDRGGAPNNDDRGGDNRGSDNRSNDNRSNDNRGGDNRGGDNRGGDNRSEDDRRNEGSSNEDRRSRSRR